MSGQRSPRGRSDCYTQHGGRRTRDERAGCVMIGEASTMCWALARRASLLSPPATATARRGSWRRQAARPMYLARTVAELAALLGASAF